MNRPPIADPEKLHELVVAYLDGELSAEDAREVEQRLSTDERFRETLQSYQQTWDMLEQLPRGAADCDFAESTVEMVAVKAADELDAERDGWIWQLLRQWTVLGLSVLAACIGGFLVTNGIAALLYKRGVMIETNAALIADLPVIENVARYELAQDIDFLRAFAALPHTVVDDHIPAGSLVVADLLTDEPEARRARIVAMTPAEKQQLADDQIRFAGLNADRQRQLRDLHQSVVADAQAPELAAALDRFYEWFKQLSWDQRDQLRWRTGEDRIAYVHELRRLAEKEIARQRVIADVQAVVRWMEDFAVAHQQEIAGPRGVVLDDEAVRRRQLFARLWQRWHAQGEASNPAIASADFAALQEAISPQLRAKLAAAPDAKSGWKLLTEILPAQVREALATDVQLQLPGDLGPQLPRVMMFLADSHIDDEHLAKFFKEELSKSEQMRLERLAPEDFQRKLRQLYFRSRMEFPGRGANPAPNRGPAIKTRQPQLRDVRPAPAIRPNDRRSSTPTSDQKPSTEN